jgi:hypothetical protein
MNKEPIGLYSTGTAANDRSLRPESGLWGWLHHRTGLNDLVRATLDEPIPGGARFAYVFGPDSYSYFFPKLSPVFF